MSLISARRCICTNIIMLHGDCPHRMSYWIHGAKYRSLPHRSSCQVNNSVQRSWSRPRHHSQTRTAPHNSTCYWMTFLGRKQPRLIVRSLKNWSRSLGPLTSHCKVTEGATTHDRRDGSDSNSMARVNVQAPADGTSARRASGEKVVVGLSGGVDSAVAAMLLQKQGYEVMGVFMRNWDSTDEQGKEACPADADLEDVKKIGKHLGILIYTVDFSRDYWHDVFAPSLEEISLGRTPNFDVSCNRHIKFNAFRKHALCTLGADYIATGHYARTGPGPGEDWSRPVLLEAEDANKDQTYFLSAVPSSALTKAYESLRASERVCATIAATAKVLFPLGNLTKPQVRKLAAEALLPVANKRESMGVCFVGKRRSWRDFVSQYIKPHRGNFVCVDSGNVLGKHEGTELYTIGQKANISGMPAKYYVVGFNGETRSVLVAKGSDHRALYAAGLSARVENFHWVAGALPPELRGLERDHKDASAFAGNGDGAAGQVKTDREQRRSGILRCLSRTRHRDPLVPCTVQVVLSPGRTKSREKMHTLKGTAGGLGHHGPDIDTWVGDGVDIVHEDRSQKHSRHHQVREVGHGEALLMVKFEQPSKAVAPGQVVALYKDSVCLGGGIILRPEGHCAPVRYLPPPVLEPPRLLRSDRQSFRPRALGGAPQEK